MFYVQKTIMQMRSLLYNCRDAVHLVQGMSRDVGTALSFLSASLQGRLAPNQKPPNEIEQHRLLDAMHALVMQLPAEELQTRPESFCYATLALLACVRPSTRLENRLLALDALLFALEKGGPKLVRMVLPAVCSSMIQLISGLDKEPHQVLLRALCILQSVLVRGIDESAKSSPETLTNLTVLVKTLEGAARRCTDSRVMERMRALTEALMDAAAFNCISSSVIQLASTCDINIDHCPVYIEEARRLRSSLQAVIEDDRASEESRTAAFSALSWVQAQLEEGMEEYLHLLSKMVQSRVESAKCKQLVTALPFTYDLTMLHSSTWKDMPVGGLQIDPSVKTLILAFEKAGADTNVKTLVVHERPEASLYLLGACIQVSREQNIEPMVETIVDQALILLTESMPESSVSTSPSIISAYLHCLVCVAGRLGPSFAPYCRFVLMDILTWLALPDPLISSQAGTALQLIIKSMQSSPQAILQANMHHILEQLGLQMRCPTAYPLAPRLLALLLRTPTDGMAIDPEHLTDLLDEVIENLAVYRRHEVYVHELLEVISGAAAALKSAPKPESAQSASETEELSPQERMTIRMMTIVGHFLQANRRKIRLRALDCISYLSNAFSTNPDAFLPLVHTIWPALLARVFESDVSVACRALGTIASITCIAQGFMQSRVNKELWPGVHPLLMKNCPVELRIAVFDCFQVMGGHVKLALKTVEGLAHAMVQSLGTESPSALKEVAMKLGECLVRCSPDSMWFVLVCQLDPTKTQLDGVDLVPYKLGGPPTSQSHLTHLQSLLAKI